MLVNYEVSLNGDYGVIVVGGGPAGCAAAIRAARDGARVLLIEGSGALGGMSSGGMVPEFCPYTDGEKVIHRGIAEEILHSMKEHTKDPKDRFDYCTIDAEWMKRLLDDKVSEAGAEALFFATVCGASRGEDGAIYLTVATKAGLTLYTAPVVVDCTGDGDVAAFLGCEFQLGDTNGATQMPTLCFTMCGIKDEGKPIEAMARKILPSIIADTEFPLIDNDFFCAMRMSEGLWGFNAGHVRSVACLDRMSISRGMAIGREKAEQYLKALKKYMPEEFSTAHITATAPLLGVRETRRIVGEYTLTVEDYVRRRVFPDQIARNSYAVDLHDASHFYENKNANTPYGKYGKGDSHGIPLRCLIPRGMDDLLVAGRCISCERPVQSSLRIIPVCFVTGEAAGAVAAIRAKEGLSVRQIDAGRIKI